MSFVQIEDKTQRFQYYTQCEKNKMTYITAINNGKVGVIFGNNLVHIKTYINTHPNVSIDCNLTLYHAKHGIKCLF